MIRILLFVLLLPVFCAAQSIENIDIKNGFLQFRLGDSISKYKDVVDKPSKKTPSHYPVKMKAFNKLRRYLDYITLVVDAGTITEIDVDLDGDYNETYMDNAMKKCYGDGVILNSDNGISEGIHKTTLIWEGRRVTASAKKLQDNMEVNGLRIEYKRETITFRKTGDLQIDGQLSSDFQL